MFPVQNSGILHRRGDDGGHDDVHVRDSRSHNLHRGDDGHDDGDDGHDAGDGG